MPCVSRPGWDLANGWLGRTSGHHQPEGHWGSREIHPVLHGMVCHSHLQRRLPPGYERLYRYVTDKCNRLYYNLQQCKHCPHPKNLSLKKKCKMWFSSCVGKSFPKHLCCVEIQGLFFLSFYIYSFGSHFCPKRRTVGLVVLYFSEREGSQTWISLGEGRIKVLVTVG